MGGTWLASCCDVGVDVDAGEARRIFFALWNGGFIGGEKTSFVATRMHEIRLRGKRTC